MRRRRFFSTLLSVTISLLTTGLAYRAFYEWPKIDTVEPSVDLIPRSPNVVSRKLRIEDFSVLWTRELRADLIEKKPLLKKVAPKPLRLQLLGTILEQGNNFAMVKTSHGRSLLCREGDEVEGVKVLEIRADGITVRRDQTEIDLRTRRKE